MVVHVKNLILVCIVFLSFTGVSQEIPIIIGGSLNEYTLLRMELLTLILRKGYPTDRYSDYKEEIEQQFDELSQDEKDKIIKDSELYSEIDYASLINDYAQKIEELFERNPELGSIKIEREIIYELHIKLMKLNNKLILPLNVSRFDRLQKLYQELDSHPIIEFSSIEKHINMTPKNQQELEKQNLLEVIEGDSCVYRSPPRMINLNSSSCTKSICSSEVTCNLNEKFLDFYVSCGSLSMETCPSALDCATDGLVTERSERDVVFPKSESSSNPGGTR